VTKDWCQAIQFCGFFVSRRRKQLDAASHCSVRVVHRDTSTHRR